VLSFLMLFVELALIRWSGALVIYLSYFSNFVLLGSFLGIGIGFPRARALVEVVRTGNAGIIFFGYGKFNASGPPTWVTLPIVFLAVAAVMAMIGEGVARTFITFPALDAYRLDIAGSITGIAAFSVLSFRLAAPADRGAGRRTDAADHEHGVGSRPAGGAAVKGVSAGFAGVRPSGVGVALPQ
jgi:hypothetical protein